MTIIEQIDNCIPASGQETIPWNATEQLFSEICFSDMQRIAQNPVFHGEGDVYTHTRMVCRELAEIAKFQELPGSQRTELFLAALLHDIGKVKTTRLENGEWVSPHHASVGSQVVREFLWNLTLKIINSMVILKARENVISSLTFCLFMSLEKKKLFFF